MPTSIEKDGQGAIPTVERKLRSGLAEPSSQALAAKFPPLEHVTSPTVATDAAAYYLNRQPQTLRAWAMGTSRAPLKPIRLHGRLMWPTSEIRVLLGVQTGITA